MLKTISKGKQRTTAALSTVGQGGLSAAGSGGGGANDAWQSQFYTAKEILPYLTQEEQDSLRQEVLTTINNELLHAEDLEVAVPRLLRSCSNEARELRRGMNSISSSQIVEAQRALQVVQDSRKRIRELRDLFLQQGELIKGMGTDSSSYRQLRQLNFLRENVGAVIQWSNALKEVRYENLYKVVQQRQFASMYKRLKRLQKIRRTVITKAGAQYRSFQTIFEPYFSKLDAIMAVFVNEIFTVLTDDAMNVAILSALEDTPDGTGAAVEDSDFIVLKECVNVCGEEIENPILNFGSDGVEQESPINTDKVYEAVEKNVAKLWEEQIMIDVVDPFGQISVYLEQMKKVEPLLEALELTLIPLSTKLNFFEVVVCAIHTEVMRVLEGYVDPDAEVEANGLMEASQFVQWYREMLINDNYATYVDLSSVDELSAAFMTAAVGGLSAHLTRLCRACAITVCNDPKGPTILPSGYPITTGPVDMFTVLQQTLGGLTTAIDMGVMRQIGKACADAIYSYLDECKQRSDFDYWEEENGNRANPQPPEEWQQRRMLFLYAFCNDCTTIENNLDTVELKFASCWEFDLGGGGAGDDDLPVTPFQKVQDALPDHAFYYLDEIAAQVERVVGAQWALLFRPGPWYQDQSNPTQLIIATISEYIDEEFVTMLQEQRLRKVTRQMLTRFVQTYLSTLVIFLGDVVRNPKKNVVEDWNAFLDCITRDTELALTMWRQHVTDGRGQLVDLAQKALEVMRELLAVKKPVDFNYLLQDKLLDDFGDCPSFVIRFCFEARQKELDKDSRDRLMGVWQERTAFQRRDKNDTIHAGWSQGPSFFGAIDRGLADLDRPTGFFGKSAKKKHEEAERRKQAEEKEAKRAARRARREADLAASSKVRVPKRPPRGGDNTVEVASLADILK